MPLSTKQKNLVHDLLKVFLFTVAVETLTEEYVPDETLISNFMLEYKEYIDDFVFDIRKDTLSHAQILKEYRGLNKK